MGSLIDCLCGIHDGLASLDILDKYDEVRRQIFLNHVDVVSTANFRRIMQDPEGIAESDPFFQLLTRARQDPEIAASLAKVSRREFAFVGTMILGIWVLTIQIRPT